MSINTKENILLLNKAAELGRKGFHTGFKAPAQDAKCLKMLEDRPIGDMVGLAILDSWLSAWHYEQMRSTITKVDERWDLGGPGMCSYDPMED